MLIQAFAHQCACHVPVPASIPRVPARNEVNGGGRAEQAAAEVGERCAPGRRMLLAWCCGICSSAVLRGRYRGVWWGGWYRGSGIVMVPGGRYRGGGTVAVPRGLYFGGTVGAIPRERHRGSTVAVQWQCHGGAVRLVLRRYPSSMMRAVPWRCRGGSTVWQYREGGTATVPCGQYRGSGNMAVP